MKELERLKNALNTAIRYAKEDRQMAILEELVVARGWLADVERELTTLKAQESARVKAVCE